VGAMGAGECLGAEPDEDREENSESMETMINLILLSRK